MPGCAPPSSPPRSPDRRRGGPRVREPVGGTCAALVPCTRCAALLLAVQVQLGPSSADGPARGHAGPPGRARRRVAADPPPSRRRRGLHGPSSPWWRRRPRRWCASYCRRPRGYRRRGRPPTSAWSRGGAGDVDPPTSVEGDAPARGRLEEGGSEVVAGDSETVSKVTPSVERSTVTCEGPGRHPRAGWTRRARWTRTDRAMPGAGRARPVAGTVARSEDRRRWPARRVGDEEDSAQTTPSRGPRGERGRPFGKKNDLIESGVSVFRSGSPHGVKASGVRPQATSADAFGRRRPCHRTTPW